MKEEIEMLTIVRRIEDVWQAFKYEYYELVLKDAMKKAMECSEKLDAEGMKYWNDVCRKLVQKREEAFVKRLELRGYAQ